MNKEHRAAHCALHLGIEILKISLKIAAVTAAFATVNEIRKIHDKLDKPNRGLLAHFK